MSGPTAPRPSKLRSTLQLRPEPADTAGVALSAAASEWTVPGLTPPTSADGARRRLGQVLVELGYLTDREVEEAAVLSRAAGRLLGQFLISEETIDSSQLARALALRNGLAHIDLSNFEYDRAAASLIDAGLARRYRTVPVAFVGERELLVATADPANIVALDDITMATGYQLRRAVASPEDIEGLISQLARLEDAVHEVEPDDHLAEIIELREHGDDAPVVQLVNSIIADAVDRGASDVHLEPRGGELRVRFRVDGVVRDITVVPRRLVPGVISRIKIMAELDIAKRRVPRTAAWA